MLTVTSGVFRDRTGIHICTKHTAKMKGMWSLSTTPRNPLCEARSKIEGSICSKCYSDRMMNTYSDLEKCLTHNAEILNNRELSEEEIPKIGNKLGLFRFESFGDVTSKIQVLNYFHIAEANARIKCALWTKNPWIIQEAMQEFHLEKPKNLVIIGSSYFINEPMTEYYKQYDFIDYIFTVYDQETIDSEHVDINCGGRSCAYCRKCYTKTHDGYEIREKLK